MLSLLQMQQSTVPALRRIAETTRNRQYSIACDHMAHAMEAHARGEPIHVHVESAKRAHKRAHEDETGQLIRVRHTDKAIKENA